MFIFLMSSGVSPAVLNNSLNMVHKPNNRNLAEASFLVLNKQEVLIFVAHLFSLQK